MISNFIWNPIECIPKDIEAPILAWTNNDKLVVFKDTKTYMYGQPVSGFKKLVDKYKIKFWVYQDIIISNSNN